MEADFNAANKMMYGIRMLEKIHKYSFMHKEIFIEQNCTAADNSLKNVLFYDIIRQSQNSAVIASVLASNC